MFVRWKKRTCRQRYSRQKPDATYSAFLVKSVRINGKPRQKVIAYLHSIRASKLETERGRYYFWYHVAPKLRALPIPEEEKHRVSVALQKVVPPPNYAQ